MCVIIIKIVMQPASVNVLYCLIQTFCFGVVRQLDTSSSNFGKKR